MQLGPFALLGRSYGGFIALEFAVRYPTLLTHLVLVASFAGPVPMGPMPTVRSDDELRAMYRARWPQFFAGANKHDAVLEGLDFSAEAFNLAFQRELPAYDRRERIAGLDVPALLVVGDADHYVPHMRCLSERLSQATLEVIPRCGHFPFLESPDAFRAAVDRFLAV